MENPIKTDDLGGKPPYFRKHLYICGNQHGVETSTNLPMIIPDWRFFKHPSAKPEAVGVSFTVTWMDGTWDPNELKQNEDHLIVYMILLMEENPAITSWGW